MRDYISRAWIDKSANLMLPMSSSFTSLRVTSLPRSVLSPTSSPQVIPSHMICKLLDLEWLESTAKLLVADTLFPVASTDPVCLCHGTFLHTAFMYVNLRNSIRWENGPEIIRRWKWWIPRFLGTEKRNYAIEATNLIINISADFPRHIVTHNRTINMDGRPGHGKPIDQLLEHYNL